LIAVKAAVKKRGAPMPCYGSAFRAGSPKFHENVMMVPTTATRALPRHPEERRRAKAMTEVHDGGPQRESNDSRSKMMQPTGSGLATAVIGIAAIGPEALPIVVFGVRPRLLCRAARLRHCPELAVDRRSVANADPASHPVPPIPMRPAQHPMAIFIGVSRRTELEAEAREKAVVMVMVVMMVVLDEIEQRLGLPRPRRVIGRQQSRCVRNRFKQLGIRLRADIGRSGHRRRLRAIDRHAVDRHDAGNAAQKKCKILLHLDCSQMVPPEPHNAARLTSFHYGLLS
jgi:hypothetical protein